MTDIKEYYKHTSFIKPYYADIHIYAALKQILGSLNTLGSKRWVHGIFRKELKLAFQLLLFGIVQLAKVFFELIRKDKLICHRYFSKASNNSSTLEKVGRLPSATFLLISAISFFSSSIYFFGYTTTGIS